MTRLEKSREEESSDIRSVGPPGKVASPTGLSLLEGLVDGESYEYIRETLSTALAAEQGWPSKRITYDAKHKETGSPIVVEATVHRAMKKLSEVDVQVTELNWGDLYCADGLWDEELWDEEASPKKPPKDFGLDGKVASPPALLQLEELIDERSYQAILKGLSRDVEKVSPLKEISFHKVYDAQHKETGEPLIVKVTDDPDRARIEARAGHLLSKHKRIGRYIQRTAPEPFEYNGMYITVQEKNEDQTKYDIYCYMTALAVLHAHGKKALQGEVKLPKYKPKRWEAVIDVIPSKFKYLQNLYEDITKEQKGTHVIHSDTKPDNLKFGKLLDLEGLSEGKPATDVSLYLLLKAPLQDWDEYILGHLETYGEETGQVNNFAIDNFDRFSKDVRRTAIATGLKELSGLYSRPMGDKEREYVETIEHKIPILAKQQTRPTWIRN